MNGHDAFFPGEVSKGLPSHLRGRVVLGMRDNGYLRPRMEAHRDGRMAARMLATPREGAQAQGRMVARLGREKRTKSRLDLEALADPGSPQSKRRAKQKTSALRPRAWTRS